VSTGSPDGRVRPRDERLFPQNAHISALLASEYSRDRIMEIWDELVRRHTLEFTSACSGLFTAATRSEQIIGYDAAWIRDNVHIANALSEWGHHEESAAVVTALLRFMETQHARLRVVIADPELANDPSARPHVRFDAQQLTELSAPWAHAQNDALGYLIWIVAKFANAGIISLGPGEHESVRLLVEYLAAIRYWQDEDSGHWEEARKVSASSIGAVVAGLVELRRADAEAFALEAGLLDHLVERGRSALSQILPYESRTPFVRVADAALLFLIYPLAVVQEPQAAAILDATDISLLGNHGVRRYERDSFYCTDYESKLGAADWTRDFSGDIGSRDALAERGSEAEWCVFDPILSCIYGRRYLDHNRAADRRRQIWHFNRSLAQLTGDDSPYGSFKCPELYYSEGGRWRTSRATPLLWTQANLVLALLTLEQTCDR
jgi:phosphorylase kinase alpha/beta subunit